MYHLPNQINSINESPNVQIFRASSAFQAYHVPEGAVMLQITLMGAGGGGGNGRTAASSVARSGGGGGGSAAITTFWVMTALIPKILFIQVPVGVANAAGPVSNVLIQPDTASSLTMVARSGNQTAGVGGGGAGAGGAGGGGGARTIEGTARYLVLGVFHSLDGQAGSAGGTSAGVDMTPSGIFPSSGGAGGGGAPIGGADQAGGSVLASGFFRSTIPGGAAGTNRGSDGYITNLPYGATGGSGGGSSQTATGGAGGNAAIGCGAGGGGGGTNDSGGAGGAGGRGGDAYVSIVAF